MDGNTFDYLVIGSGIAGLSAAKTFADLGARVAVLTKNEIHESSTEYAQGGIAVAMQETDSWQAHFQDTIAAGKGLCNQESVSVLVKEGPDRVRELIELGTRFDKTDEGLSFTKEAAHSTSRILHVGDSTGREIEKSLGRHLLSHPLVTFIDHITVVELILEEGRCVGCVGVRNLQSYLFFGKAVMLATGGCGQVFQYNTNPPVATGDGIRLAYNAGAVIQDMEFFQFHPTTFRYSVQTHFNAMTKTIADVPVGPEMSTESGTPVTTQSGTRTFLISEALRGEGAWLVNDLGHRFMQDIHPDAELAPRDLVAKTIFDQLQSGHQVFLDLRPCRVDLPTRFPTIYATCLSQGIDLHTMLLPVSPAAHYCMGGVRTDINAQTSIDGLYAAGEVASLGVHGANRLASNSLLDGLVFGYRGARHAVQTWTEHVSVRQLPDPLTLTYRDSVSADRYALQKMMWEQVGIVRSEAGLLEALSFIQELGVVYDDLHTLDTDITELQSLIVSSYLITQMALKRQESRGAHFRSDFQQSDDKWLFHLSSMKS